MDQSSTSLQKTSIPSSSWTSLLSPAKPSITKTTNDSRIAAEIIPKRKRKCYFERFSSILHHPQSYDQFHHTSPRYYPNLNKNLLTFSHYQRIVISTVILTLLIYTQSSNQQSLCPKSCVCDEISLEVVCQEGYDAARIPHTLNPGTKRIIIYNTQISQFTGLDYLDKLETLNLAHNKLSSIEFREIGSKLVLLNTSHNNIRELKDDVVTIALNEHGLTPSMFQEGGNFDPPKPLKKLVKINVINFVVNHNNLTKIRDLSFMRWHKLQSLDLSFNIIDTLGPLSLFGLEKLESLNLRGNKLRQVPTLALQSTMSSVSSMMPTKSSKIKHLYLSENTLESIQSDSFSMLGETQELFLDSCSLRSIEEQSFRGLHTLNLLSLDKNNLDEVPSQSFSYLPLLRTLKINANNISSLIPESFNALVNLEELQMNNATFKEIQQGVFDGLDSLKRLEVAYNPSLKNIESSALDKLTNLLYLNLNSDSLASLSEVSSEKLSRLDLRGNPLNCGCDLKWLTRWLKKSNETSRSNELTNSHLYDIQNHLGDNQAFWRDSRMTNELHNLTCSGPPALFGKMVAELPENKLECLKPNSDLNVHIGFATLFVISFLLTFVCLINFCRNKKHLFFILKENLVHNHITMMMPYNENLHKNVDELKKETQLYNTDYESVDYNQRQFYSVNNDQVLYYEPQQYSQHI